MEESYSQPHVARDGERVRAEVPRRRADADRAHAGDLLQRVGRAHLQVALGFQRQHRVALVDPAVDADLVAFGHHAALLVGIQQRGHGGHEEARRHAMPAEDVEDARHALAVAVLALRQLADGAAAVAQLVGLVVGVEGEARPRSARRPSRPRASACGRRAHDRRCCASAPRATARAPCRSLPLISCVLRSGGRSPGRLPPPWPRSARSPPGSIPRSRRPSVSNSFCTSGSFRACTISVCSRATISGGAPAGSQAPNQLTTLKSLKPCSCMVGTSGMPFQRSLPVTASARSLPSCTSGSAIWVPMKNMSMWPPSKSVMAAGVPLYGTCSMSMSAARQHHLRRNVAGRSEPGLAVAELARLLARQRDQLLHGLRRQRGPHDQHLAEILRQQRDVREVLHRVVGRVGREGRNDGMRRRGDQHGVAVRPASWRHRRCRPCRPRRRGSRRSPVCPSAVVQLGRDDAGDLVGRPAGRRRHDDADQLVRDSRTSVAPARATLRTRAAALP